MEASLLKRGEHFLVRPIFRVFRPSLHASFGGIDISYREELDGGGTTFGQDFLPYLRARGMPRQKRVFEWCSGPGFIGFSLLGNGFCDTLCLADINRSAVASCQDTVRANKLADPRIGAQIECAPRHPGHRAVGLGRQQSPAFHRQVSGRNTLTRSGLAHSSRVLPDCDGVPRRGLHRGAPRE